MTVIITSILVLMLAGFTFIGYFLFKIINRIETRSKGIDPMMMMFMMDNLDKSRTTPDKTNTIDPMQLFMMADGKIDPMMLMMMGGKIDPVLLSLMNQKNGTSTTPTFHNTTKKESDEASDAKLNITDVKLAEVLLKHSESGKYSSSDLAAFSIAGISCIKKIHKEIEKYISVKELSKFMNECIVNDTTLENSPGSDRYDTVSGMLDLLTYTYDLKGNKRKQIRQILEKPEMSRPAQKSFF